MAHQAELTTELLDFLGDKFVKERIYLTHRIVFDDFVYLWVNNLWEVQLEYERTANKVRDLGIIIAPDYSFMEVKMMAQMEPEMRKRYIETSTGMDKLRKLFEEEHNEE